jgi:hypothetical protein
VCFVYLLRLPLSYNFNNFAFWDWGSYLLAHSLLQQGYRPLSDFGWQYGLLPLRLQELAFGFLGASPVTFICLGWCCVLVVAVTMARLALVQRTGLALALMLASLPLMLAFGPDLPHSLEAALLSFALLRQAQARRGEALAFATAACFTKPTMGYVYVAVLTMCILIRASAGSVPSRHQRGTLALSDTWLPASAPLRQFVPAIAVAIGLAFLLVERFGGSTFLGSLLPLSGARAYQALHFGWRGVASALFYFPGVKFGYYVGTAVTFWVCGTLYLAFAGAWAAASAVRNKAAWPLNEEMVLTCTILHLCFIAFFYGSPASWTYYAYILIAGILATTAWRPLGAVAIAGLCSLAALANYGGVTSAVHAWTTMQRSGITAGLFASPDERAEWNRINSLAGHLRPALCTQFGAAELLFPWLRGPAGAFILPGIATQSEIRRKAQQLRSAGAVIIPIIPGFQNPLLGWPGPEFRQAISGSDLVFSGTYFQLYERHEAGQRSLKPPTAERSHT